MCMEMGYVIILTYSYKDMETINVSFHFDDYREALDYFKKKCIDAADFISSVDAMRIVGLYRVELNKLVCKNQVQITGFQS